VCRHDRHRLIDYPLKPEEALSQTQRQAANEWYDHTLYSRLNEKLSGTQLIQELIDYGLHAVTRYQPQSDGAHWGQPRRDM
jgi:hypothetical protein